MVDCCETRAKVRAARASAGETPPTRADAAGRLDDVGQDAQQRGLAAARCADQRSPAAFGNIERAAGERGGHLIAPAIDHADIADGQSACGR